MKIGIVKFSEIASHPTTVLSAEYWINIKAGKLPFNKGGDGLYTAVSHTAKLNTATYLTEAEAHEVNIALSEIKKATDKANELKSKYKL